MSVQGRSPAGTTLMPDAVVEFPLLAEGPLKGGPGLAQRQQGKCVSLQLWLTMSQTQLIRHTQ